MVKGKCTNGALFLLIVLQHKGSSLPELFTQGKQIASKDPLAVSVLLRF